MKPPDWFPDWAGETVVIVASGPSAKDQPLELARDKARFIVVNSSWQLAPWADMLYACDYRWWNAVNGCPEFTGLKVSIDTRATDRGQHPEWNVLRVRCDKTHDNLELERPGMIGWGGNSGFGAINIAAQLGVAKIILVGFDMSLHAGLHWHGIHPPKLGNPRELQLPRWRRAIDRAAEKLVEAKISVYNASPYSKLRAFPKLSFEAALAA